LKVFYAFHYLECHWLLKVDAHWRKMMGICNRPYLPQVAGIEAI